MVTTNRFHKSGMYKGVSTSPLVTGYTDGKTWEGWLTNLQRARSSDYFPVDFCHAETRMWRYISLDGFREARLKG